MEIRLTKFTDTDFDDYYRLVGNAQVMAMITERPIPEDEARRDFDALLKGNLHHKALGQFRILDAEKGDFIGLAKLNPGDEDGKAELGYMLLPEYWGKGIAGEAAALLVDLARQQSLHTLFAIIDPANKPSRKILVNNGFEHKCFKEFDGLPGEILELSLNT